MTITLKYAGKCRECGTALPKGTSAHWQRRAGVTCFVCKPTKESIARASMAESQAAWNQTMNGSALHWRECPTCGEKRYMTESETHCRQCEKRTKPSPHQPRVKPWHRCPDCGRDEALTPYESKKGYHCKACTATAEFGAE